MSDAPQRLIGGGVDLSHLAQRNQTAAGAEAGAQSAQVVDVPAAVFAVTEQSISAAMQLSNIVPVLLLFVDPADQQTAELHAAMADATRAAGGKLALGVIDGPQSQQLVEAFGVRALPACALLLKQQPEMVFEGAQNPAAVAQLYPQIVNLAAAQGMTGSISAPDLAPDSAQVKAPNPAHEKALAAVSAGDYQTAITEYESVLQKDPRDAEAKAALAQVNLLDRLAGATVDQIRSAAAAAPQDVAAQLAVADLDVSGGHVEDAFLRLLELFQAADSDDRSVIQARLLELFEVVGQSDARVNAARRQLANLLY